MKIEIKNRYTGDTLFECEAPEGMSSGLQMRHGDNEHAREYRAALALVDLHAELWTPKGE